MVTFAEIIAVSMPYTGGTSFLQPEEKLKLFMLKECQCPTRAGLHFYPTSLRSSVYAGFKPLFFAHFSEYSDIFPKQGIKVGKAWIVFFNVQFIVLYYSIITKFAEETTIDFIAIAYSPILYSYPVLFLQRF